METLVVQVTQKDINCGVPGNMYLCPIARAVRRKIKKANPKVSVDGTSILIREVEYTLPKRASDFTWNFDTEMPVKPFKFVAKRYRNGSW
jgi:hypothetical protein